MRHTHGKASGMTKPHKGAITAALTRSASRPMCQLFSPRMLPKAIARSLCADFCPCAPSLAGKGLTILHLAMTAPEPPLQAGIFVAQQEPSLTGSAPGGRFCTPGFPLTVRERKSTPKRFCDGTLPQRLNPSQCHFSQKTALHVMYSYDRMYLQQLFYASGFSPLAVKEQKRMPKRLRSGALPQRHNPPPCFFRKPPCMSCTATTRCICGNYFTRRVPSCCQRAKVHAQALPLRGFAPTAQSAAARFLRKPSPNTMFSYDRMYPWQYFARRGSSLLSKNKRACLSAFATGFCYNATIRRSATFHRKPPCMPCTATTGCVCGGILHAGVSPRYQRAKNHTQAPLRQDFAQRYNPPRPVSPENRPGMPCAVMTRCIR